VARKAERMEAWRAANPRQAWALDRMEGWYKAECVEAIHSDLVDDERLGNLWMIADQLETVIKESAEGETCCVSCDRAVTYTVEVIEGSNEPNDEDRKVYGQVHRVTWICQVCDGYVCRWCAFRNPDDPLTIHENTYCGEACWKADGSPTEIW